MAATIVICLGNVTIQISEIPDIIMVGWIINIGTVSILIESISKEIKD